MSFHMKNATARRALQAASATLLAALASAAHADWGLNMPEGVSVLSTKIYGLHMTILWVCVVIAVVVFGAMIYSMVKFRRSKGAAPDKTLVHSTKVEIVWTVIPIAILVAIAVPIGRTLIDIENMSAVVRTSETRAGACRPVTVAVPYRNAPNCSMVVAWSVQSARSGTDVPVIARSPDIPDCAWLGLGSVEATNTRRSVFAAGMACHTPSIVLAMTVVAAASARPTV